MARVIAPKVLAKRQSLPGYCFALPELRIRREARGVALVVLADKLGIPRPTLSRIENLGLRASPERQEAIAAALSASHDVLFAPAEESPLLTRDRSIADSYSHGTPIAAIAAQHHISASRVDRILKAQGVGRERHLTAEAVDAIVAAELGIPRSTVFYWLVQRGVKRRPQARPRIHPAGSARPCHSCGTVFTPDGDRVARGEGRFCTRRCAYENAETRRAWSDRATAQHLRAATELAELCARDGLLTVRDAATELMVAANSITGRYIPAGLLPAKKVKVQGLGFWVIKPVDLRSFKRAWLAANGPTADARMRWRDADFVVANYRGKGLVERLAKTKDLSLDEAEAVIRARVLKKNKGWRNRGGRPPKIEMKGRLLQGLQRAIALDWASDFNEPQLLAQVALFDCDDAPEDWDYSPERPANRQTAIEKVRHHIGPEAAKALQTLQGKPT